jgi:hypothetical protein
MDGGRSTSVLTKEQADYVKTTKVLMGKFFT